MSLKQPNWPRHVGQTIGRYLVWADDFQLGQPECSPTVGTDYRALPCLGRWRDRTIEPATAHRRDKLTRFSSLSTNIQDIPPWYANGGGMGFIAVPKGTIHDFNLVSVSTRASG